MEKIKFFDIQEMKWNEDTNGMRSCVFKPNERLTMQYWEIKPGSGAQPHNHPHEQLIYIQQGCLQVTIEGNPYELGPGCFCMVPAGAEHATLNRGPQYCINVDIFIPEREDRRESERIRSVGHKNWD